MVNAQLRVKNANHRRDSTYFLSICTASEVSLKSSLSSRVLKRMYAPVMPNANNIRSYATTGINPAHWFAVIGTVHTQAAPPTECAANVAPKLLRNAFSEYFWGSILTM